MRLQFTEVGEQYRIVASYYSVGTYKVPEKRMKIATPLRREVSHWTMGMKSLGLTRVLSCSRV